MWSFTDRAGTERRAHIAGPVLANNGSFLEALAIAGVGIAREPDFIVGPDVRAGRLVPLLREFAAPSAGIHVVYPSRRHLSAKVRAFTDFLAERFRKPDWTLDLDPPRTARQPRGGGAPPSGSA